MLGVFICYRRLDSAPYAGRIADFFANEYSSLDVFMDITGIDPGDDFEEVIRQRLAQTSVVLALIGDRWLSTTHADGSRRIDDPRDILRLELSTALAEGKRVIPVLLDGAPLPAPDDLPEPLRTLPRRNAYSVRHENFDRDLRQLATFVGNLPKNVVGEPLGNHPKRPAAPASLISTLQDAFAQLITGGPGRKFLIIADEGDQFVQFTDVFGEYLVLDLPTQPLKPRQLIAANRLLMERFEIRTQNLGDGHFAFQTQVPTNPEYLALLTVEIFSEIYDTELREPQITFG